MFTWGSTTFVKKVLTKFEVMFGKPFPKREVHSPLDPGDHPELEFTQLCDEIETPQYQSMIKDMEWVVSMGRIHIYCVMMKPGGFRADPRRGHLEHVKQTPILEIIK